MKKIAIVLLVLGGGFTLLAGWYLSRAREELATAQSALDHSAQRLEALIRSGSGSADREKLMIEENFAPTAVENLAAAKRLVANGWKGVVGGAGVALVGAVLLWRERRRRAPIG